MSITVDELIARCQHMKSNPESLSTWAMTIMCYAEEANTYRRTILDCSKNGFSLQQLCTHLANTSGIETTPTELCAVYYACSVFHNWDTQEVIQELVNDLKVTPSNDNEGEGWKNK